MSCSVTHALFSTFGMHSFTIITSIEGNYYHTDIFSLNLLMMFSF
jgi:hypothetical protein